MRALWVSCAAVIAAIAVAFAVGGGVAAAAHYGGAEAQAVATAPQGSMTPAGMEAWSARYQGMANEYFANQPEKGIPVQWHDVFTGVGVTIGALAILGAVVLTARRHGHAHPGRLTTAH